MSSTITTDGRALADAATLIRKLIGKDARARLVVADGRAEVEGCDGSTAITDVVGHGVGDGPVAIAVDLDALRAMRKAGPVTIRDTVEGWSMSAGGVTSTLIDAVELPTWPTSPGTGRMAAIDVRGDEAVEVAATLRSVATAAASDTYYRAILHHVEVSDGRVAATDTYRLNVGTVPTTGDGSGLIPASWARALPRRGVTRLTVVVEDGAGRDAGHAELTYRAHTGRGDTARTRDVTIVGRTDAGPFPNYQQLMPDVSTSTATLVVPDGIGDVLARMGAPVTITVRGDGIDLVDPAGLTAAIATATTGGELTVALNPGFLADLADHVGEGATLHMRDGLRALLADQHGRASLLMPMRA